MYVPWLVKTGDKSPIAPLTYHVNSRQYRDVNTGSGIYDNHKKIDMPFMKLV